MLPGHTFLLPCSLNTRLEWCTYQLIGDLQRLVTKVVCHKCCTAVKVIEFLVREVSGPHCGTDELLEEK